MQLRLLEFTVPTDQTERIPELINDTPILHQWTAEWGKDTALVRVLLDAKHVEALSDALLDQFGSRDDFRLIALPVEETLPVPEPEEESESEGKEEAESDKEKPQRISREELYQDLEEASSLTTIYAVMVALSTVVAAVGLIRGDVAIIIGAMVMAPLLGPNVALSLACTLGDPALAKRSLKAIAVGVAIVAALALLFGAVITVDPNVPELAARTRPGFGDIMLALAAGAAGTLAFTSGVSAVVVGVMVAVALLPPLVAAGLLAGSGQGSPAAGALILFLINVTCVNLAAVVTFLVQKIRPRSWWEAERAKKATRIAVTIWIFTLLVLLGLMLLSRVRAI